MRTELRIRVSIASTIGLLCGACYQPRTAQNLKQVEICKTTNIDLEKTFGPPRKVGQMGGKTTWSYCWDAECAHPDLVVLFDDDRYVSDVVLNPAGLVELKSRCGGQPPAKRVGRTPCTDGPLEANGPAPAKSER